MLNTAVKKKFETQVVVKWIVGHFFLKVERPTKFCFVTPRKQNLLELVSYGKFGFSRPDLDGNKSAKGKCLARKVRDRSVYLVVLRVINFSLNLSQH